MKRRLPKRGFTNIFKKHFALVDVGDLAAFEANSTVDAEALVKKGLIKNAGARVKVLGDGDIDRPLILKIDKCSKTAFNKITAAGGQIEEI